MIYLSDDYVSKYQEVLGYLIGRALSSGYSIPHIEKTIAYSLTFSNFEKSDITDIAFSSNENIYSKLFNGDNNTYQFSQYDVFGWVGYTYIRLFFDLNITFETLFYIIPIDSLMNMYHLYHEMDYYQTLNFVKNSVKHSYLDIIMNNKGVSVMELSILSGVASSTIRVLRYRKRDIDKLEAQKLLKIANALRVKPESLLTNISLIFDNYSRE